MPRQRLHRLALACALGVLPTVAAPSPVRADDCHPPGQQIAAVPWAQTLLNPHPDNLWRLADGTGVKVAVIDSGVDATTPQLNGHVLTGTDFLHANGSGQGNRDCVGHGTAVASLIAAQRQSGIGLAGLAPGAQILPVVVTERQQDTDTTGTTGDAAPPARVADAIRWSWRQGGATVLNCSFADPTDHPEVRAAIAEAIAHNIVVVAGVGNEGDKDNKPQYPAAYPGVIGVGAIDEHGTVASNSEHGTFVSLVAPGVNVTHATRGTGQLVESGTSLATPFVSAIAALIRSRWPTMPAPDVTKRLLATANPAPGAKDHYGYGIVAPTRALTENTGGQAVPPVPPDNHPPDTSLAAARSRHHRDAAIALGVTTTGIICCLVLAALIAATRIARHHGWRPRRAAPPRMRAPDDGVPVGLLDAIDH